MSLSKLTLTNAREQLRQNEISASDLADACFRQIECFNPVINAFITVLKPKPGKNPSIGRNPLLSMPIAIKDLYETKGIRTTAGSKFFADYIPEQDAYVVQKFKESGAIILGKTNTHEIALGVTNNNPHYGACKNPWDLARITGGSSGGSAAAAAADMCLAAVGTDTGGSIRIPASLCGVVGLKPTYGRVSLRGIIPLSWNLDHAGPITKTVEDAALMLQVMAGYDPLDPASVKTLPGDFSSHLKDGMDGRTIALGVGEYIDGSDAEVLSALREAAKVFESLGAKVKEVEVSWLRQAALANGIMTTADGAAYHRDRLKEHPDWFGEDVRQRLEMGAAYTSTEYSLTRRTQAEVRRECEALFERYDILLLPTTPIPAPLLEGENAIERARLLTRFTAPFNLTGLPALTLPCGFTSNGLPIGLQIVSRAWNESGVLRAGFAYEQATEWHTKKPNLNL
ncbi:MAG: Asp-tRNA(Asn)/Glu-tRNA(Gln) amidotransferase subunit GatA [Chloroflexi bacterium]|nr:Asp-tRNA(Asn)/Glu-tRNA(Gln) amidotransferase subunit GatA [Chloroflexota bacterium]